MTKSGEIEAWPYADAIDVMLAHHAGLRVELGRLRAIDDDLEKRDFDSLGDAAQRATMAIDLFGRAGELHEFDEEELLFPKLRAAIGQGEEGLAEALDRALAENVALQPLWPRLAGHLTRLAGADEPVSLRDLRESRLQFEECMLQHLRFEERFVYPAARRLLDPEVLQDMMVEMRAHRRYPSERAIRATP
jgi:hemerythrin-like domain-containing protein